MEMLVFNLFVSAFVRRWKRRKVAKNKEKG
jgi:hypothetical protein